MTREQQEFNYYCLDRTTDSGGDISITYNDTGVIRTIYLKCAFITDVYKRKSIVFFNENDEDAFLYMDIDDYYQYEQYFVSHKPIEKSELNEILKFISTMTVPQFASLLNFVQICSSFFMYISNNWDRFEMDRLVEI